MLLRARLLLLLLGTSALATPLSLRSAAQEDSAPKFVRLADGRISGICIELLRAMETIDPGLRIAGLEQSLPLPRLERMLEQGQLDLACGLIHNPQRAEKFRLLRPALYTATYGFAIRRGDSARPQSWADLARVDGPRTVLAVSGSGVISKLNSLPGISIDTSAVSPRQNLVKLQYGRGRVFYYRLQGLQREILEAGLGKQIEVLPSVIDEYSFHLALSRSLPSPVVERLQAALLKLHANKTLARLILTWQP